MGISTGRQQQRKSMSSSFGGKGSGPTAMDLNMFSSTAGYSAAFPSMSMMSPLSHLPEGMRDIPLDNPYKNLMDRMKEVRDDEDSRDTREGDENLDRPKPKDLGPMPFSILPPHMLNMMERIKSEGEREAMERERGEACSPMNLSSEREADHKARNSEGSFAQSPSPGSGDIDSPSQASPPRWGEYISYQEHSPFDHVAHT